MTSLVDLTKYVVARIYPALVWGTLMGLAVHAGLKLHFLHDRYEQVDADAVSVISDLRNDIAPRVPTTVRFTESTPARTASLP